MTVPYREEVARAGNPALIGTTHEGCDPEECHDGKRWSPDGPMCSENGILGWYDCPDGRPVYGTVSE